MPRPKIIDGPAPLRDYSVPEPLKTSSMPPRRQSAPAPVAVKGGSEERRARSSITDHYRNSSK